MGIPALATQKKAIKCVNSVINMTVLTVIVLLLAFAGYALWDSKQIHQAADKSQYAVYKPTAVDEGKSFQELQALNAEVFAWLSVYGTNIDYPVTQGQDNMKYVNTNAEGLYSLSGAIFLDYGASPNFSDFNSILYGHHMEKKAMFGEIGSFAGRDMFDTRKYGNLYFDGKDHGIEFFAFVHTDAYDGTVFAGDARGEARQAYLDNLLAKAIHKRDIGTTTEDRILLLITCSSASTNGRDILVGRITRELYEDTFIDSETDNGRKQLGMYSWGEKSPPWPLMLILLLLLTALIILLSVIRKKTKAKRKKGQNK